MFSTASLSQDHQLFLEQILRVLKPDNRFLGLTIGGSFLTGKMDLFSDLDLTVLAQEEKYQEILKDKTELLNRFGKVTSAFSGEHVGEPRLMIALYEDPLLHVDFKFLTPQMLKDEKRVENPHVFWERDRMIKKIISETSHSAAYPEVDFQWIEDRFWVWIHYIASKLGRGELFEAIEFLSFLRTKVFAPMAKAGAGFPPRGVRHLEFEVPELLPEFKKTLVCSYDKHEVARAIKSAVSLYKELRAGYRPEILKIRDRAEFHSINFLDKICDLG